MIFLSRKGNDECYRPAWVEEYHAQENPRLGEHPDENLGGGVEAPWFALKLPAERIFFVFPLLHFGQTGTLPDVDESVSVSNTLSQSLHWNS